MNPAAPFCRCRLHGVTLIYATVILTVLMLFVSLGVDLGRVQLAKAQVQDAADAAARYAVTGLVSSSNAATARNHAKAVIAEWNVEGAVIPDSDLTVTSGTWNEGDKTFTAGTMNPNAVKVDLQHSFAPRAGRPGLFVNVVAPSFSPVVHASSIAIAASEETEVSPPASGNLWLSGMPAGTQSKNFRTDASHVWDYAGTTSTPRQSALELDLDSLDLQPGDSLTFEGLSGTASYVPGSSENSADGLSSMLVALGATYPGSPPTNSLNGMSNVRAPIGAIMAVFLTDDAPNLTSAPSCLDFGTAAQRDYATLSPQTKQVFFVGDGKRANGEVQKIVVPTGATRVFIGMMDAWQWNDNVGNFKFNVYSRATVDTVK